MTKFGVIGGSGIYTLEGVGIEWITVVTPYGEVEVGASEIDGREVFFMPRHGRNHSLPPHKVNYRGNIWALASLGVKRIIATNACGSLNTDFPPGYLVLPDQFLDFTKARPSTFYDEQGKVAHTDMTVPYCPQIREEVMKAADKMGFKDINNGGTYVTTEGPRFETAAEIKAYRMLGGDLVGMTSVPEVVLAREAGMCYASISIVTNFAAGISPDILTHDEVLEMMSKITPIVGQLILETIKNFPEEKTCQCPWDVSLLDIKVEK